MDLLLYLAIIPALGVLAQWSAARLRIPSILVLLSFGILLGRFVSPDLLIEALTGGTDGAGSRVLLPLVSLAVAVVLFEGGLSLEFRELGTTASVVFRLCTLGAGLTMIGTAIAAHTLLGLSRGLSLLLGGIFTVTGPTVIGPLLRQMRLKKRVAAVLKWEGIVIDPIGAILAVLVFEEVLQHQGGARIIDATVLLLRIVVVGGALGALGGGLIIQLLRRYWLPDHLHGIATLAVALLAFAGSNSLADESGLVAVTVMGVLLVNQRRAPIVHIIEFKEHLRTLLIGCLFIVLGSRLEPADVLGLGWRGLAFVLVMIVVVRPLSVLIATLRSPLDWRERLLVAAMAPRGIVAAAVASVFALRMETFVENEELTRQAAALVPVTFALILGTVTVYGLGTGWIAQRLDLARPNPTGILIVGADPWVRAFAKAMQTVHGSVILVDSNFSKVTSAKMEGLSSHCANILSEHGSDDVDLSGIGTLLALTPNDEVNSLATRQYRASLGSAHVYQLATKHQQAHAERWAMAPHLRGRILFNDNWTFTYIRDLFAAGASFKISSLTPSFTLDDFRVRYGEQALILMAQRETGSWKLATADKPLVPAVGRKFIALVASQPVSPDHVSQVDPEARTETPEPA